MILTDRMKKTLIITLEYPPQVGGIATYVKNLATSLSLENTVVLAPSLKHDEEASAESVSQVKIIRANLLSNFVWPHWLKLYWQVRKIVKQEKIELLMVHHVLPVGYIALLIKFFHNVPYLIFSHGTDIAAASRKPWKRRMVKIICKHAWQIITNSESLARRFKLNFSEFSNQVTVLYPGPEKIFFDSADQPTVTAIAEKLAIAGRPTIISVARMVDGKGFPHLTRIIKQVADKAPSLSWLIIGQGPKLPEIVTEVQKNNLQNIVRFIGEVPHDQLPNYFHTSTVFALLTHPDNGFEEGLGLVFLEAAATGLPCVAGKSGGVEEAIVHGKTGFVFDVYRDQAAIVESLLLLITDPQLAQRMGAAGRERVSTEFNFANQIKKLQSFLN